MKRSTLTAMILLFTVLFSSWSTAHSATDGSYDSAAVMPVWEGTDASRLKAPTADYDYTYGDDKSVTYTLPWPFTFYGQEYSKVTADTNGNIWFSANAPGYSFNLGGAGRGPVISAWNDDLSSAFYGGAFVQHKTNPERVVVQWQTETYTEQGLGLLNDFEVVLFTDGNLRVDYKNFDSASGKDFVSGISKDDNQHYLSLSSAYGNVYTLAGHSFLFSPARPNTTSTIWPPSAIPTLIDTGPDRAVELGVKFVSDSDGFISGIRFFKSAANTGVHEGHLWTASGQLLAMVTFSNETASGWQQANFSSPVAIAANTTYVASYHTKVGHYSDDLSYFANNSYDNPPLHAPADAAVGGNGVYAYGQAEIFPSQSWNGSNYWVDVVFSRFPPVPGVLTSLAVQPQAPILVANGTEWVTVIGSYSDGSSKELTGQVTWSSSDSRVATIAASGLATGVAPGRVTITATFGTVSGTTSLTVQPAPLTVGTDSLPAATMTWPYTATLTGTGGTPPYTWSVKNGALPNGLTLDGCSGTISGTPTKVGSFSFTIQATDSGSTRLTAVRDFNITAAGKNPILVISSSANPFSGYYPEILRAEGFTLFDVRDVGAISAATLAGYDVVLLGEIALSSDQVTLVTNWVDSGGRLIAMRPDKKLAGLLGISDQTATLSDGYLLVDTSSGPGLGITAETMQFHSGADLYALNGAASVATLFKGASTPTLSPAVTLRAVGNNGGQAAAFAFDLARSVIYTRQGNPAWAGQKRDGYATLRPDDLFYGAATSDPQPDWVDPEKIRIPQADEQQRFLANLIIRLEQDKKPIPRFWYLPRNLPAAVVLVGGDPTAGEGTAARFDLLNSLSAPGCSVEKWECLRGTSYLFPTSALPAAKAYSYDAAGFEVGMQLSTNCQDWTSSLLEDSFTDQLAVWSAKYGALPRPVTGRTYCVAWGDYASMPAAEARKGIRLDTNYYYWPPSWVADRPGFFTGSGLPMRFADAAGRVIDVYQAAVQLTDESRQSYPATIDTLLDGAIGPEGYYGVFTASVQSNTTPSTVSDTILSSAATRGIPVISARQLLSWLDGRNSSAFGSLSWGSNTLSFSITSGQGAVGMVAMAPVYNGQTVTRVTANGNEIPFSMLRVKGILYATFAASTASYVVSYDTSADRTPPTVLRVSHCEEATGVELRSAVKVTFSEAIDPSSLSVSSFALSDHLGQKLGAEIAYDAGSLTATLTPSSPLAPLKTFRVTIKGGTGGVKDIAGNTLPSDYSWTFSTIPAAQAATYSLWSGVSAPGVADSGPDNPVELGVRFSAESDGYITGVRFFKAIGNTGAHVANLWTVTGTLLATATFTNETDSGWQQVDFPEPVAIGANTTYVASYHTDTGHYSDDESYFASDGVDSNPLHAARDTESSPNGVYAYGSAGSFPNLSWNSCNYWVDVVFRPTLR